MNSFSGYLDRTQGAGRSEGQSAPRVNKLSYSAGHYRRFGAYFSSRPSILDSRSSQESDETSWEMVTLDLHEPLPQATEVTEAQKVAMMYRMRCIGPEVSSSTLDYPPPRYSDSDLLAVHDSQEGPTQSFPEKQYAPIIGSRELRVNLDAARQRSLLAVFQEAMDAANKCNPLPGQKNRIVCPRFGCGNSLPNTHALICHLHIHDIADHLVICYHCKNTYEHPFDMHTCPKPSATRRWNLIPKRSKASCSSQSRVQIMNLISSFWFS